MTATEKISSLEARLEDAYREALRIGGLPDEEFREAEALAYNALLERMAGINEYLAFLKNGCEEKKPARTPRTFQHCITCGGDAYDGQLCGDCQHILNQIREEK